MDLVLVKLQALVGFEFSHKVLFQIVAGNQFRGLDILQAVDRIEQCIPVGEGSHLQSPFVLRAAQRTGGHRGLVFQIGPGIVVVVVVLVVVPGIPKDAADGIVLISSLSLLLFRLGESVHRTAASTRLLRPPRCDH